MIAIFRNFNPLINNSQLKLAIPILLIIVNGGEETLTH